MPDTPPVIPAAGTSKPAQPVKVPAAPTTPPKPPAPAQTAQAQGAAVPAPPATTFTGALGAQPMAPGTPQPPPAGASPLGSLFRAAGDSLGKALPSNSPLGGLFGQGGTFGNAMAGAATQNTPPLSYYTHHLGDAKPIADSVLSGVQQMTRDPARFGQLAGMAPGLTKGLLSTPMGLPAMLGLHGLLSGGQALGDARTVFKPMIDKIQARMG